MVAPAIVSGHLKVFCYIWYLNLTFDIATSKMKNIFFLVAKTIMNISYRLHIYTFISDNNKGVQNPNS